MLNFWGSGNYRLGRGKDISIRNHVNEGLKLGMCMVYENGEDVDIVAGERLRTSRTLVGAECDFYQIISYTF